jgi:hypothetical protein
VTTDALYRRWTYLESMVPCSHLRKTPQEETPSIVVVMSSLVSVEAIYGFCISRADLRGSPARARAKGRFNDSAYQRRMHLFLLEDREHCRGKNGRGEEKEDACNTEIAVKEWTVFSETPLSFTPYALLSTFLSPESLNSKLVP